MMSLLRSGLGGGATKKMCVTSVMVLPKGERVSMPFSAGHRTLGSKHSEWKSHIVKGKPAPIYQPTVSFEMPVRTAEGKYYISDSITSSKAVGSNYYPLLRQLREHSHEEDSDTIEGFVHWLEHRKFLCKRKSVSDGEVQSLVRLNCFAHQREVEALHNDTIAMIYAAGIFDKKKQGLGKCYRCGRGTPPALYDRCPWYRLDDCWRALESFSELPTDHYDPKLLDLLADRITSELRDECADCWPPCFRHMLPAPADKGDYREAFIFDALQDAYNRSPANAGVDTMPVVWNYTKDIGYPVKLYLAEFCQRDDAGTIANCSIPRGPAPNPVFPIRMMSHPQHPLAYTHVVELEGWVDRKTALRIEIRIRGILEIATRGSDWVTGYIMEPVVQTPMTIYLHLNGVNGDNSNVLGDIYKLEGVEKIRDCKNAVKPDSRAPDDW